MTNPLYKLPKKIPELMWLIINVGSLSISILAGLCLSTQYIAKKLNYMPELGTPMFGKIYNPLNLILWQWSFGDYPMLKPVLQQGASIFILIMAVGFSLVIVMNYIRRLGTKKTEVHGSAHWAKYEDILKAGFLNQSDGMYIGAWENKEKSRIEYLRHNGDKHVLAIAPTRSGKGVGLVLPTLLSWKQSVLVHDIKGENWAITAGWRKEVLGQKVLKFDPTCDDGTGASFNPLYEVRLGNNEVRDVQNIADMIVDPHGKGKEDHWTKSAHALLVGVFLHVLYAERDKTLAGAANLLSDTECSIEQTFERMLMTNHDADASRNWTNNSTGKATQVHPVVSSVARDMLNKPPEERSSIVSTAISFLTIFRDPVIAKNTSQSDFRIEDLMNHEKPVSLYLIVPPSDISRTRVLMRLILNQISRRLVERMKFDNGQGQGVYKHKLLLMLDEFASLGKLESFQDALAYMAGYGLQAYLIIQDISQLYTAYGKNESIMSNCHVRVAFAANKIETAEMLSKMAGIATVTKHTKHYMGKRVNLMLPGVSEGSQEVQRSLITADEAMRLPEEDELVFISNMPPIYGKKIKYFEDNIFKERAKVSPPAGTDTIAVDVNSLGFPVWEKEKETEEITEDVKEEVDEMIKDFEDEVDDDKIL